MWTLPAPPRRDCPADYAIVRCFADHDEVVLTRHHVEVFHLDIGCLVAWYAFRAALTREGFL